MDDAVKTKEGVRIGDKKDKVLSAYGSDYTEADGQLLYESCCHHNSCCKYCR